MRTNINSVVTNCTVVGNCQGRVVSLRNDSCAHAAQHLESRHASKRARSVARAFKRWSWLMGMAGAGTQAKCTRLAITGPARPTVRLTLPVVVLS